MARAGGTDRAGRGWPGGSPSGGRYRRLSRGRALQRGVGAVSVSAFVAIASSLQVYSRMVRVHFHARPFGGWVHALELPTRG